MKSNFVVCNLFIFILLSCSEDKTPKIVTKDGMNITLPGFVKEDELADDASIEYANRYRNFYVVAMKVPESDSAWYKTTNRVASGLISPKIDSNMEENTIITKVKGSFKEEKEPIYYTMKLITKNNVNYLLTVWTRGDERYKKHEETIDGIVKSFNLAN